MKLLLNQLSGLVDDSGSTYINYCRKKARLVEKKIEPGHRVLDVGCGVIKNHRLCFDYLQDRGFDVRGVDRKAVKARKIEKGSIKSLKYKKSSFDVVICLDVIEHVKDYKRAISELERVARKRVILVTPVTKFGTVRRLMNWVRRNFGIGVIEGHYHEFFKKEIVSSFRKRARARVSYMPFPLPVFSSFLHKRKILSSGVFVVDFI